MRFLVDRVLLPLWRAFVAFGLLWVAPVLPPSDDRHRRLPDGRSPRPGPGGN
jgi:hypothetical protein